MVQWLGDYVEDETVYFLWSTNAADGASITRSTDGTVQVYKDNGVAQSVAGVTDTEDFDGLTGIHACTIDLSADAFYAIDADYAVVLAGATIDGQTVNAVLAHFSIENRFDEVDVTRISGDSPAADNLELDYDGTGYNKSNSTVGTATAVTNRVTANTDQIEGSDATDQIRDSILDDATRFSGADIDQSLSTTESNIRGADSDTLKTLSDQLDAISADAFWDTVMDANAPAAANTGREYMNIIVAVLAAKYPGSGDWGARDLGDTKDRVRATLTAAGLRSSIDVLDGT